MLQRKKVSSPPAGIKGFTLLEALLIIVILSMLAFIVASTKAPLTEERAAALTVAKTYSLLDLLYAEFKDDYARDWSEPNICEYPGYLSQSAQTNGFGYPIHLEDDQCTQRLLNLYQYIPEQWAGYVEQHVENTQVIASDYDTYPGLFDRFPDRVQQQARGFVIVRTVLDLYGNPYDGPRFVRESFHYSGNSTRSSVLPSGVTQASIYKPECENGNGQARIHYQVKGIASYFPREGDPANVGAIYDANDPEKDDFYTTSEYRSELDSSASDAWRVRLIASERWDERDTSKDIYDSDGDLVTEGYSERFAEPAAHDEYNPSSGSGGGGGSSGGSIWETCGFFCFWCCYTGGSGGSSDPVPFYLDAWVWCE